MAGIRLTEDELIVERPPNDLDELAIQFTGILNDLQIDHVYVSGYVAILAGRSRATEDIDVLLERVDAETIEQLTTTLEKERLWGPATPLTRMEEMLTDHIWVARAGEMVPHLEVKYVDDRFDEASLGNRLTARIGEAELPIGPLELQIAYKLWMGSETDIEDALHLFLLFEESLRTADLERWVRELEVQDQYERLRRT